MLAALDKIQQEFHARAKSGTKVSLADLNVLAGTTAVERAAHEAGFRLTVSFTPGWMDASTEPTDAASFAVLEPYADGFCNYLRAPCAVPVEVLLVDRAQLLNLTVP